jgi:hypothetical protein
MSTSTYASQYFLQSIIDFLREKTIQHRSLGTYFDKVKTTPHDALEFLEKVIMPRHDYEIAKQRNLDTATASKRSYNIMKILVGTGSALVAVGVLFVTVMYSGFMDLPHLEKARFVVLGCLLFSAYVISIVIVFNNMNDGIADATSLEALVPEGDAFFDAFENPQAIALFYALNISFPPNTPTKNRSAIIQVYNKMTKPEGSKTRVRANLESYISGGASLGDKSWRDVVESCKPGYIAKINPNDPGYANKRMAVAAKKTMARSDMDESTLMELAELDDLEDVLAVRNLANVFRQLQVKTKDIYEMVERKEDGNGDEALAEMDVASVMKKRVVPMFMFENGAREIRDMVIREPDALATLGASLQQSPDDALMLFIKTKECNVAVYDASSKKFIMFSEGLPRGCVFRHSPGSRIFLTGKDDQVVFVEGKEPDAGATKVGEVVVAKEKSLRTQCLTDDDCTIMMPHVNSIWRTDRFKPKDIKPCLDGSPCLEYKANTGDLATLIDVLAYTDTVRKPIQKQLLQISEALYYTLYFSPYLEIVQDELSMHYDGGKLDTIMMRVADILEEVDAQVKKRGSTASQMHFMPKTAFYDRLDAYSVSDINYIRTEIVLKLHKLVSLLQRRVQSGVVQSSEIDDNPFVSEERQLRRLKHVFLLIANVIMIVLVWHITKETKIDLNTNDANDAMNKIEGADGLDPAKFVAAILPSVLIAVVLTMMYAYYHKRVASFEFNRDILENNTTKLINSMFVLTHAFDEILATKSLQNAAPSTMLKSLDVEVSKKEELYDDIVSALVLFEKCNLISKQMSDLPFPVTDVAINVAVIMIVFAVMVALMGNIFVADTMTHIQRLHAIIEEVKENPRRFKPEDFPEISCETSAAASLRLTGIALVVVVSAYLIQLLGVYPHHYKKGLYNSKYYSDGKCVK